MIATTPSGTRICRSCKPLGRTEPRTDSPTGSGRPTSTRRPSAIAATLDSVSRNRSTNAAEVPAASAAATSCALAARILSVAASKASAIAPSAASFVDRGSSASPAAAVRARRAAASTSSREAVTVRSSTSEVIVELPCR